MIVPVPAHASSFLIKLTRLIPVGSELYNDSVFMNSFCSKCKEWEYSLLISFSQLILTKQREQGYIRKRYAKAATIWVPFWKAQDFLQNYNIFSNLIKVRYSMKCVHEWTWLLLVAFWFHILMLYMNSFFIQTASSASVERSFSIQKPWDSQPKPLAVVLPILPEHVI